jgi:hypothetical protein
MPAAKPVSAAGIDAAGFQSPSRLIEPLCEWALIDWAGRTALPELLDVRFSKTTKDRLSDAPACSGASMTVAHFPCGCDARA